jgi:hypothetical protein
MNPITASETFKKPTIREHVCPGCKTDVVKYRKQRPTALGYTAWDGTGLCPACRTWRNIAPVVKVVGWGLLGLFALFFVYAMARPAGEPGRGRSCESAYQEVLQRQTAGTQTDGALRGLANCQR